MRVLFLDIDGVLNSEQSSIYYHRLGVENGGCTTFACPIAASNMKSLLDEFLDLKIVVSSVWRRGLTIDEMRAKLMSYAMISPKRVIGMTPVMNDDDKVRGDEIQAWLDQHPEVTQYVIVDDDSDMGALLPKLVKTSWRHGFLRKDVLEIMDRFYAPWVSEMGYLFTKAQESGEIDTSFSFEADSDGTRGWVKDTFWGKGPVLNSDRPAVEEWATWRIKEEKRRGHEYRTFRKQKS